jgi:tetratricopeptide (TPR) repeat protein
MNKLFISLIVILLFNACNSSSNENSEAEGKTEYVAISKMSMESLEKEIKKREKALKQDSTKMDKRKAADLMEAYATYAERFSNRANSADRLFKAGELAMGLNHTTTAIKYLTKVYDEYPDYEKRPYSLFLHAFVLENQAQDLDQAKSLYEKFIVEYPTHAMADDAKYSIENMGKSPEELIREFEVRDSIKKAQEAA